jgi:protein-glutamine gamma-glutamyltransferase
VLLVVSWVLVLVALAMIQRAALSAPPTVEPVAGTAPAGRPAAATPVFASLAAGLMVFLVLPAGLGGGDLAAHLVPPNHGASALLSGRSVVGVDTTGSGTLSLLVRGALPTTPLLRVPLGSPALWRGSIYPIYTGDSWEAARSQRYGFAGGNDVSVPASASDPVPVGTTRTDRVEYATAVHGSLLWAPGVPLQVLGTGGTFHGVLRGPAGVRIAGAQDISGYQVESAVATTSPGRLNAASGPDRISAVWTALPTELPASVGRLARQIVAGTTTRYEEVAAIESYLRRNETYSLSSPIPGPGQDAVADFLFRDHTGFCEQFASAAAVMLRTLDVPARVVSGLAYGTPDGGRRLFTAADAHAWIEVYYPGIGWSPSDPTAGAALAGASRSWRSPVAAAVHRIEAAIPGGRAGLAVVAVAGLLAVTGAARVARARVGWRRGGPVLPIANRPVLAAFHRFAGRRGPPAGRAPPETAREFLERLDPPRPLDAALATLERECYGTRPPDAEQTLEAVAAFEAQRLR